MINVIHNLTSCNNFSVKDLLESQKRQFLLSEDLPNCETHRRLLGTMYMQGLRFLDLLAKRYGNLEAAIEAGENGEAFVAQAIKSRESQTGGLVAWCRRMADGLPIASSHVKQREARDILQKLGVIIHHSNGKGNVGQTRINVRAMLVLLALLEDLLDLIPTEDTEDKGELYAAAMGFKPAPEETPEADDLKDYDEHEGYEDCEESEEDCFEDEWAVRAANKEAHFADEPGFVVIARPVPKIAKIMHSRWKSAFGMSPRSKDMNYQYPQEIDEVLRQSWESVATMAKPITKIPQHLALETIKYCKERAKTFLKGLKDSRDYVARAIADDDLDYLPM
jgi:hypothetical protein